MPVGGGGHILICRDADSEDLNDLPGENPGMIMYIKCPTEAKEMLGHDLGKYLVKVRDYRFDFSTTMANLS